ncbi:5-formyltetrahydrofolate cyclo-ligase [Solimicrobium silvestre]|uniref:5-formyltetrahydrofolate cyclo-ligase n=1 Tax=Solimicrobium silvestre TaxID=2099400 RepID=A0A2S9H2I7_9BURK|nr:5-formyltetrahydrofolate cyclo-ligase [Solimicrobium silvestre]PRC94194.1 5-formyltetrahydrofolate cyclo-ligase [Solimicrobium silvestre]
MKIKNMNRTAQRAALIAARRSIGVQLRNKWDMQIAEQVFAWCKAHSIKTAGIYSPIQAEPCLFGVYPLLTDLGVKLALPSAPVKDHALTFSEWVPGDELMKDRYGVLVPLETAPVVQPEVLFIPCVGFTADGYRLGYGGGFYDRTLAAKPKPKAIGIAYRISLCELEIMPHDIAMDSMITDY